MKNNKKMTILLCSRPIGWRHNALMAVFVCLSVCPEERRKLKIGRRDAHDTGDQRPHLEVKRSRSPGRLTP